MFKNPFSFEGRIRRLKYGISYLIYFAVAVFIGLILGLLNFDKESSDMLLVLLLLPAIYFVIEYKKLLLV